MVTLRYKQVLIYKYGCVDRRFRNLGGTQLLLWNAIHEAKNDQLSEFDMCRSDCGNSRLVLLKDRWDAKVDNWFTFDILRRVPADFCSNAGSIGKYIWSRVPHSVLAVAGRVLYRYIG